MAMAMYSPYKANEGGGVVYPRDASFSSYLDTSEMDFVRSLAKSINNNSSNSPSPGGRNFSRVQRSGELDVFGAERYFNENLDEKIKCGSPLPIPRRSGGDGENNCTRHGHHHHHHHHHHRREKLESKSSRSNMSSASSLKSPAPSLKSQGSFHSHIGLLLPKKGSVGHKIFSSLQCKGSCFDKKSVFITNNTQHQMAAQAHQSSPPKSPSNQGNEKGCSRKMSRQYYPHQEHFAFPVIDTASQQTRKHDQSRSSLDEFGVHQLGKQEIEHNLEKKLSVLAWDAIPTNSSDATTSFPFRITNKTSPGDSTVTRTCEEEDGCSDASSDLFEIENLSVGGCGSPTSTPYCYEPSEGSVEWSVVTASAADHFSTACSDRENDLKTAITIERRKVQKRSLPSGGIFLGCTNYKAVDVVGNHNNQRPSK